MTCHSLRGVARAQPACLGTRLHGGRLLTPVWIWERSPHPLSRAESRGGLTVPLPGPLATRSHWHARAMRSRPLSPPSSHSPSEDDDSDNSWWHLHTAPNTCHSSRHFVHHCHIAHSSLPSVSQTWPLPSQALQDCVHTRRRPRCLTNQIIQGSGSGVGGLQQAPCGAQKRRSVL